MTSENLIQLHDITAQEIYKKLIQSECFRTRMSFEMGDSDLIVDVGTNNICSNLNYIPAIKGIAFKKIRVFQNNKTKWEQFQLIFISKFIFHIDNKSVKIKSKRIVTQSGEHTSRSQINILLLETEFDSDFTKKLYYYVKDRMEKENELLGLKENSEVSIHGNFSLPFENVLSEIRNYITELDNLMIEESSIDHSILNVVNELDNLRSDLNEACSIIEKTLKERDKLQQKIKNQSIELINASSQIKNTLLNPDKLSKKPDKKNDVAFVFSFIPLVIALSGYILQRN